MAARSLSPCWSVLALLGLGFVAPALAKPPDLPNDPRDRCEVEEVERIGVDFAHLTPAGQPTHVGYPAPPAPERRYSNGNPLLRCALCGIHPALALLSENVLHCDDDEAFPVLELLGEAYDTGGLVTPQATPPSVPETHTAEQQIVFKVTVAQLSQRETSYRLGIKEGLHRTREIELSGQTVEIKSQPMLFDNGRLAQAVQTLCQANRARLLAEPTLVTLDGQPATFLACGEFPPPACNGKTAGDKEASAVPYAVQFQLTPHMIDKDRIRLAVDATVSVHGSGNSGDTVSGRNLRATVEIREGQTLVLGDLMPLKNEQSQIVLLVTPELIHPTEPKAQAPPSVCPYLREKAVAKPICADENDLRGDVLANLEQLEMAEKAFKLAEFYRRSGHPQSAQFYYDIIHRECPGSRYDVLARARVEELKRQSTGQAEECEEPEAKPDSAEPPSDSETRTVPKALAPTRCADVAAQIGSLLMHCQQALATGDCPQARQLAAQAIALDACQVAAHPLVYKMQLLQQLDGQANEPVQLEDVLYLLHWGLGADVDLKAGRWRARLHLPLTDFDLEMAP